MAQACPHARRSLLLTCGSLLATGFVNMSVHSIEVKTGLGLFMTAQPCSSVNAASMLLLLTWG